MKNKKIRYFKNSYKNNFRKNLNRYNRFLNYKNMFNRKNKFYY